MSDKLELIKFISKLRYDPKQRLRIHPERDLTRGSYYVKYKEADLRFHKRMKKPDKEFRKKFYDMFRNVTEETLLPEITTHPSLCYKNEPILYLTQVGITACLENLCWAVFTPYQNRPRINSDFVRKVRFVYDLIEFRMKIIIDSRNNFGLLDSIDYTAKFGTENITVNMNYIRVVGAHLDFLYLTIYDSPKLVGEGLSVFTISEKEKDYIFNTFLEDMEYSVLVERFNKYYASLIITDADVYVHNINFPTPSTIPTMVLQHKNDRVWLANDETRPVEELRKTDLFNDFMFWYAYKQCYYKEVKYTRNRLLDVYMTDKKTYATLAGLIYDNYKEKLFADMKEGDQNLFELEFQTEEEANLDYLYPPEREDGTGGPPDVPWVTPTTSGSRGRRVDL